MQENDDLDKTNNVRKIIPLSYKRNLKEWKSTLDDLREDDRYDIMMVIDTETTGGLRKGGGTGVSIMEFDDPKMRGKNHRILEIGVVFCKRNKKTQKIEPIKDSKGGDIYIHEYIDPFSEPEKKRSTINTITEIQQGAFMIHGISKGFLSGIDTLDEGNGVKVKIEGGAKHFQDIVGDIIYLAESSKDDLNPVYAACHNFPFDAAFLDFEFKNCVDENNQEIKPLQSLYLPFDTIHLFKSLISKKEISELKSKHGVKKGEYSLDTLTQLMQKSEYMKDEFDRSLHGAYKDVLITISVYNALVEYSNEKKPKILEPEQIKVNSFRINSLGIEKNKGFN